MASSTHVGGALGPEWMRKDRVGGFDASKEWQALEKHAAPSPRPSGRWEVGARWLSQG